MSVAILIAAGFFAFLGVAFLVSWVFNESRGLPVVEIYERLEEEKSG